ncbi:MAG: DUF2271 domain-containing protein [Oscillospiraceae bacterium]|jgi:hypothetical protein|nr:DUF2271 domain-containing protein [Oscillospiraceae bacterium]
MRSKSIFLLAALITLTGCAGQPASPSPNPDGSADAVTVSFDFTSQGGYASNQFAVWVEDGNGALIKTLYAAEFTADGGYKARPDSIPEWVAKSGLASMEQTEVDAVSGATPKSGRVSFVWDMTDTGGDAVRPGSYTIYVEGSLRWKNRVVYSGVIATDGAAVTVPLTAEVFYEASDVQDALTSDSPENNMLSNVTAKFAPKA